MIRNKKGQSTIEFIVTFAFAITIVFIYVKIAFNVTRGFYVHYATFNASRVFLTAEFAGGSPQFSQSPTSSDASGKQAAIAMFRTLIKSTDINISIVAPEEAQNKVFIGAIATFIQNFAMSSFIGGKNPMNYRSESFLGRSPPYSECVIRTCDAIKLAGQFSCTNNITIDDNGC